MRLAFVSLLIALISGCAVYDLHRDQDQMRQALLDLYTDQIMDNLIRASNGMPIVQLDYSNATGTITCKQNASFGEDQTVTRTNLSKLPAHTLDATRTLTS